MSNERSVEYFGMGLFIGLLAAVPISGVVIGIESGAIQADAVKAGAAEWTIDPKTGTRAWKWTPAVGPVGK